MTNTTTEASKPAAAQEAVAYIVTPFRTAHDGSYKNGPDELCFAEDASEYAKQTGLPLYAAPVGAAPVEMSPEFTDTARAAIAWVLWHHLGGSSPVGQPLRFALGMGDHDPMPDWRIAEAKRYAELAGATTADFHKGRASTPAAPVDCLHLAVIGRTHFGNPIPQEWYAAARELLASTPAAPGIDLAERVLCVLIEEGVLARNGRVFQKLRTLIDASPKGDEVADTLRTLLHERNHRTDGDLQTLAERCLHLSRGDRDLIDMRGKIIERLQDSPKGGSTMAVTDASARYMLEGIHRANGGDMANKYFSAKQIADMRLLMTAAMQATSAEVKS